MQRLDPYVPSLLFSPLLWCCVHLCTHPSCKVNGALVLASFSLTCPNTLNRSFYPSSKQPTSLPCVPPPSPLYNICCPCIMHNWPSNLSPTFIILVKTQKNGLERSDFSLSVPLCVCPSVRLIIVFMWLYHVCPLVCFIRSVFSLYMFKPEGLILSYLCAQLPVLYTYNCLLIMMYHRLDQNQIIIIKYAVRSRYTLYTITSLV